jgi:HEAT repeat protein
MLFHCAQLGEIAMKTLLRLVALGLVACLASAANAEEIKELLDKLKDKDATVRRNAADALGQAGDKAAVPALTKALGDDDFFVRRFAAQALGKIGPDAKDAVPMLAKLVKDEHKEVAEAAADALGKIGGTGALKPLIEAVGDKGGSAFARRRAIQSLAAMGPEAKSAVSALLGVVTAKPTANKKDKKKANSDDLRPEAIKALGAIGPDAKEAVPALSDIATAKKGKDKTLKQAAVDALKKIEKN